MTGKQIETFDPMQGQAGKQALSDITLKNPKFLEGGRRTNLTEAYNAGMRGEDISRETWKNAAASNTLDQVEQMYKAGLEDAKTGSASAKASTAEAPSVSSPEQPGTATTEQSTGEVNAELEEKLAPFNLSSEERAAAEEYARTGKDSAFSNKFDRDTVKRIMDAAAVIKEHNGKNGIDSQQGEGYNQGKNKEATGKAAQNLGTVREQKVADLVGGKVSREPIKSNAGGTDIDVISPNGDLIMVGGPAKARNLGSLVLLPKVCRRVTAVPVRQKLRTELNQRERQK